MKKDANESAKKIVKKKIIGLFQKDLDVWNARKAAAPDELTDNQLFRNLLHGADSFGPLVESRISAEMKRTGLPRPAVIESLVLRAPEGPVARSLEEGHKAPRQT